MRTLSSLIAILSVLLASPAVADLGTARLQITGTRLTVSPQSQTVPFNTGTVLNTTLEGFDPNLGQLPAGLRVLADFTGPEVEGLLTLSAAPNEPLRIPRLRLEGEYRVENIRLMDGDELLAYAEPRAATVRVTQVLVTSVSSRPLTLPELQGFGVVLDPDNFQAFDLAFGFAIGEGGAIDYEFHLPVIYDTFTGRPTILQSVINQLPGPSAASTQRFQPPTIQPFVLRLDEDLPGAIASGGCTNLFGDCGESTPVALPGAIVFPTDLSLLHQFFSVVLLATNGAPAGDVLEIRDLTARVSLPPALRLAETQPPTYLGTPVPVRLPGADGLLGTADDLNVLIAQATGQAEVLVEAVAEGTHLVEFDLAGTLHGLPQGPRPIRGQARGAVAVRDPSLAITVSHPDVVRVGEEYSLLLTVTNTAAAPANAITLELNPAGLVGVEAVTGTPTSQTIASLSTGDAAVVEFRLRPLVTGPVIASAARTGGVTAPTFQLTVGVGEQGIPLSPTSILLPRATDNLPASLVSSALRLLGLGLSLASSPPSASAPDLPAVDRAAVNERVYQLTQAARYLELGDDPFAGAAMLLAEWTGIRDGDWEWDRLRRTTQAGGDFASELATILTAQEPSPALTLDRLGQQLAPLAPFLGALASDTGVRLEVASRTSGKAMAGAPNAADRLRDLPFGEILSLNGAELALVTVLEAGGYEVRMRREAGAGTAELTLLVPGLGTAGPRQVRFTNVNLPAGALAVVRFLATDTSFTLEVDLDGDGNPDATHPGQVSPLSKLPFTAVAAVQRTDTDASGHVVEVLFSADVDLDSLTPNDPSHFELPGNLSNGGLSGVESEIVLSFGNGAGRLRGSRLVRVVFSNPLDPFASDPLTVRNVGSNGGETVLSQTVNLLRTSQQPGGPVEGQILGADGTPVAGATVLLWEVDICLHCRDFCQRHKTAAAVADANGRYRFDYVRQTACTDLFEVEAFDLATGDHVLAQSRLRLAAVPGVSPAPAPAQVDLHMFGRGTVRGTVTFEDGSIPPQAEVVAYQAARGEGQSAAVDPITGLYELRDMPVGTLSLVATDGEGTFTFATEELATAGATTVRDFTLSRLAPPPTAELNGTVVEADLTTPIAEAYVALYVDGQLVAVRRSGDDGAFAFGTVPAGLAELEAFDGASGLTGGSLLFDLLSDQHATVQLPLVDERGTVEGFVFQQQLGTSIPVAGAIVYVDGSPLNTLTDAAGYYRLEGVRAGNRQLVAADPASGLRTANRVTVQPPTAQNLDPVARLDFTLPLAIEGGLSGLVLGFDGNPVPNATIHLAAGPANWYHETSTDLAGRFSIPGLRPGLYEIHALRGTDGASATVEIEYAGHTPSTTLQFRKGSIEVCVMARDNQGALVPFPGTVSLYYQTTVVRFGLVGLDTDQRFLQTGQNGSPQHCGLLTDVLAGRYEIYADNPFGGSAHVGGTLVAHGQAIHHEVEIDSPGSIRGRVLLPDGLSPAAGATVTLADPSFAGGQTVTADANGEFLFALVAPQHASMALDADYRAGLLFRQARTQVVLTRSGQEIEDVELILPIQAAVNGTVRDSFGGAVAGAVVTLKEQNYPRRTLEANADGQGNYSFINVFAGGVALTAQAPTLGGLGGKSSAEILVEGEAVTADIALEETAELSGQLLTPTDGSTVTGAEVQLLRSGRLIDRATSDGAGRFHFPWLPLTTTGSTYELCVLDPTSGRQGRLTPIELTANGQLLDVTVTLEARATVLGRLSEPASGGALPGATVRLTTHSLIPLTTFSSTDLQGDFSFGGVPEGSFDLLAMEPAPGRRRAFGEGAVTVEDLPVTVDLVLEGSGSVEGSVLSPPGAPAGLFANPNVRVVQDGKVIGATLTNPYRFDNLIVGRPFTLIADEIAGPHSGSSTGLVSQQGEVVPLDITMVPIGTASVQVVQADGVTPATGTDVLMTSSGFYGFRKFLGNTGASHVITFSEVGESRLVGYATQGQLKGLAVENLTLDGEQAALNVVLEPAGTVAGTVLRSDGLTPAAGAVAVLHGNAGRTFTTVTDGAGLFQFPAAPLGVFTVELQENLGPGFREVKGQLVQQADGTVTGGQLGSQILDDFDPQVVSILPANGTTGVAITTSAVIEFSEPIENCALRGHPDSCVQIRLVNGAAVPSSAQSWSADGKTLTLTPPSPLASATVYEVRVWEGRNYDLAGRKLPSRAVSLFTTADVVAPVVLTSLPASGANQVATNSQLQITFSEPVSAASLSGAGLQLSDLTTGGGITTTFLPATGWARQFTVSPQSLLSTDHQYRLTISGATDSSGNVIAPAAQIDFWTLDTLAPERVSFSPADGTAATAGDLITVRAEIVDERGVASVTLAFGGRSVELSAPNGGGDVYEATFPAPAVAAAGPQAVSVTATDLFANTANWQWNLQVAANPNLTAASANWAACLSDGDRVVAGQPFNLGVELSDDEGIDLYRLRVDGQVVETVVASGETSISASFLWTPPAGAAPATPFTLALEVLDFAGNLTTVPLSLQVVEAPLWSGGNLIPGSTTGTLVLPAGDYTLSASALNLGKLLLLDGARLTFSGQSSALELNVSGEMRLQCGALLDLSGRGLPAQPNDQPGVAPPAIAAAIPPDAGGSHGGQGSIDQASLAAGGQLGEGYGSLWTPLQPGASGAAASATLVNAGSGGGALRIGVGELVLGGRIAARGEDVFAGAGAGGSVLIVATTLRGGGEIDVSGGNALAPIGDTTGDGAGGGGRVALYASGAMSLDPATQVRVAGGATSFRASGVTVERYAGSGTVYVYDPTSLLGHLLLNNGLTQAGQSRRAAATLLTALGGGSVLALAPVGGDSWLTGSGPFLPRWQGSWVTLADSTGTALGTFQVAEIDASATAVRLTGAAAVTGAATYRGEYRFDTIELRHGAGLDATDTIRTNDLLVTAGEVSLGLIEAQNVTVTSGATALPTASGVLEIHATGTVTVEPGAALDASSRGYLGARGTSATGEAPALVNGADHNAFGTAIGGSHGGSGITQRGAEGSGEVYDSLYDPRLGGGGGASSTSSLTQIGGPGGGVVIVEANTLVLDGAILAHGTTTGPVPWRPEVAAGAGGSVNLRLTSLLGSGTIDASGGDNLRRTSCATVSGAAGGGRVALYSNNAELFDALTRVTVAGGFRDCAITAVTGADASPGTIYLLDTNAAGTPFGELIVARDPAEQLSATTVLPRLGSGLVANPQADASDPTALWIEPADPAELFDLGVTGLWVRTAAGDFRVIDQSADRRRLLLAGAVGQIVAGEGYSGLYKLDRLTLRGAVTVEFRDLAEIGVVDDEGGLSQAIFLP